MVNGDSNLYKTGISDTVTPQATFTTTSFTASPFISKDDLTIDGRGTLFHHARVRRFVRRKYLNLGRSANSQSRFNMH
jgi:hypothetical protein